MEEQTRGEEGRSEPSGDGRAAAPAPRSPRWTEQRAEAHLRSLELFGMRFGLERMRRMMTALGSPQRSFPAIHVVGTNGKSSTTRMIAAILERHGLRTGAYVSPHLISYTERVRVAERDIDTESFASAVARAAHAAEQVNRTLAEDDHVTQFELLTAAAFWELARREIDVAVVEAGLGGRYDATSVIDSRVQVLTSVGLEHTRWLGPTLKDIAEEKLAVVQPGSTLVLGADLAGPALAVARSVARERSARIVTAGPEQAQLLARGSFQHRNFGLARAAAAAHLEDAGLSLDERAVREAASSLEVAGRLQLLSADPPTVLDGAHNPDAIAALLESLPEVLPGGAPLALVLGVLEDKDAAAMLAPLLEICERAWFTAPPSSRALSPAALQSLARQLGFEDASCEPDPARALEAARAWALERGASVLATGSVYLVGDLLARQRSSATIRDTQADSRRSSR
ncbi:MAG TPA: folylpolyglutamate synthase/dihydrofolate synthase family protein [Solirubrobacteraceae bacterium]|jgi:dihydrofolate synthase/folylpolyglutamate synthase|nr:folylpolyglutamate synthase/dihydrofolate synthase family protein [Solirubrobacteraceae bacterium]